MGQILPWVGVCVIYNNMQDKNLVIGNSIRDTQLNVNQLKIIFKKREKVIQLPLEGAYHSETNL